MFLFICVGVVLVCVLVGVVIRSYCEIVLVLLACVLVGVVIRP